MAAGPPSDPAAVIEVLLPRFPETAGKLGMGPATVEEYRRLGQVLGRVVRRSSPASWEELELADYLSSAGEGAGVDPLQVLADFLAFAGYGRALGSGASEAPKDLIPGPVSLGEDVVLFGDRDDVPTGRESGSLDSAPVLDLQAPVEDDPTWEPDGRTARLGVFFPVIEDDVAGEPLPVGLPGAKRGVAQSGSAGGPGAADVSPRDNARTGDDPPGPADLAGASHLAPAPEPRKAEVARIKLRTQEVVVPLGAASPGDPLLPDLPAEEQEERPVPYRIVEGEEEGASYGNGRTGARLVDLEPEGAPQELETEQPSERWEGLASVIPTVDREDRELSRADFDRTARASRVMRFVWIAIVLVVVVGVYGLVCHFQVVSRRSDLAIAVRENVIDTRRYALVTELAAQRIFSSALKKAGIDPVGVRLLVTLLTPEEIKQAGLYWKIESRGGYSRYPAGGDGDNNIGQRGCSLHDSVPTRGDFRATAARRLLKEVRRKKGRVKRVRPADGPKPGMIVFSVDVLAEVSAGFINRKVWIHDRCYFYSSARPYRPCRGYQDLPHGR